MEELEDLWSQLRLIEEENSIINLNADQMEEVMEKGEKSLVRNLCSDRVIGKVIVRSTMAKVWRVSKNFTF